MHQETADAVSSACYGGPHEFVLLEADVTKPDSVAGAVSGAVDCLGDIDMCWNNAGYQGNAFVYACIHMKLSGS